MDEDETESGGASVDGPPPDPPLLREAMTMLTRRCARIDGRRALAALPPHLALSALLPFLEGVLKGGADARRSLSVIRSLRRSENLQTREALVKVKARHKP